MEAPLLLHGVEDMDTSIVGAVWETKDDSKLPRIVKMSNTDKNNNEASTSKDASQAILTMRNAILYLKELCNLSSVSSVPFEKMLPKVHHDIESVSMLIEIIKTRVDDILFFKGKPSPFETLIQLYHSQQNSNEKAANQIADLLSAILRYYEICHHHRTFLVV